jgi:hypothetical protein
MASISKTKPATGARRAEPRLHDFFATVLDTNPFTANRITEPSAYDVDVEAIHDASFKQLLTRAGEALVQRTGVGVALLGGAGVGKSHLLSRLYRWASGPGEGGAPRASYVYLHNILADPDRLPRYLLKYVVSRLSNGGLGTLSETPLYRFVDRALRHAMDEAGIEAARIEDRLQQCFEAFRQSFGQVDETRVAFRVLLQFWRFARPEKADAPGRRNTAVSALNWLSGDEIDPTFAEHLGFNTDGHEPVMLRDDEEVLQVLLALTRLAEVSRQPFVLCLDQVENLDPDKITPRPVPPLAAGPRGQLAGHHFRGEADAAQILRGTDHSRGRLGPDRPVQGRTAAGARSRGPQDPGGTAGAIPRAVPQYRRGTSTSP